MAQQIKASKSNTSKHPGGRPTKLTRELVDKAAKYINEEINQGGQYHGDLPTVAGLSLYLDCSRDSIYEWRKGTSSLAQEFSDTLDKIDATQEYKLVGKSLKGEYNAAISKLLLSNHGYVEKSKVDGEQKIIVETRKHGDDDD